MVAAFAAYTLENKASLKPGEVLLGKVNIRVVALPESGNNAGAYTVFTPQLALCMPPNIVMALMAGL